MCGGARIEFDREHEAGRPCQLARQSAGARSYLYNRIVPVDVESPDELTCEPGR